MEYMWKREETLSAPERERKADCGMSCGGAFHQNYSLFSQMVFAEFGGSSANQLKMVDLAFASIPVIQASLYMA
jgi:hypothetical protein